MPSSTADLIYLASGSPRRRELLAQLGFRCEIIRAPVDETPRSLETAGDLVCRLALAKSRAALGTGPSAEIPVVGADTVVSLGDEIMGKPADIADARRILGRLSGRAHTVWTAVAVADRARERVALSRTEVTFRTLLPSEITAYWQTGEPVDKAGAYGIQGLGAAFVASLSGSYSGVVGLPLFETARLLESFGRRVFRTATADA